jgi:hypothetical protein
MAKNIESPDDVQIASMNVQQHQVGNLMAPGPGTPWEDRGSIGLLPAFFKTAVMSMTSPGRLLGDLRRPETPNDARVFAMICGGFWGLAWVIHDYLALAHSGRHFDMIDNGEVFLLHFVLGFAGTWVILNFVSRLFYKLVSAGDVRAKTPLVLTYNVYAYCLGPSILAVIPFGIGPILALVWIFCLFVYAAIHRLAVKTGGAIVCNIFAVGGILGLAAGAYFLLAYLYNLLYT